LAGILPDKWQDSPLEANEFLNLIRGNDLKAAAAALDQEPALVDLPNMAARVSEGRDWDEVSPLHIAAKSGHLEMARLLVERGATVYSHPFCSYPPVIVASWMGQSAMVDYFLDEIPHLAAGTLGIGVTCNLAGRAGWIKQVRMHLERDRLAVHQRGWIGDTPLHWPCHNGYGEIVELLLAHGADPNVEENNWIGGTPVHWAAEREGEILRMLAAAGGDMNARVTRAGSDHLGATPLIWCAKQRDDCAEAAQTLLDLGADPHLTDSEGRSAIDYARPRVRAVLEGA
jgi:ankyrin repeat protein